jgi:hypothetical protein
MSSLKTPDVLTDSVPHAGPQPTPQAPGSAGGLSSVNLVEANASPHYHRH